MLDCPPNQFGSLAQDLNFRIQMARIQVDLASLTFDKIGALYQEGDGFVIGPEIQTGLGPWDNALNYYRDVSHHLISVASEEADSEVRESEAFTAIPKLVERLMAINAEREPMEKQFALANRDFGPHNLLVDADFNIVGLIDFDGVLAAPLPVVAQFPQMAGFDRLVPGSVETDPVVLESLVTSESLLKQYKDFVMLAETEHAGGKTEPMIAEMLLSDMSFIVEGMQSFSMHSEEVNDEWKAAFETFLEKHSA
ncbi:hypothetical protein ONS96_014414 [Cadophora gregata f. sp. sojae]|nr:hypothetical protein ONS96_014414 [Cadophora gregata f. sp. sojae]